MKYHILNDVFKMLYYNKIITKYNQEKNQELMRGENYY